jgi:putative YjhG/YagF family dehydratase
MLYTLHPDARPMNQSILDSGDPSLLAVRTVAHGPEGSLPLTDEMLRHWPSGHLFGMTQNAGMGWSVREMLGPQVLVLSTQGGIRAPDGKPVALGFHTGHWEVGLLAQAASVQLKAAGAVPFAAYCTDPCDGRTQGTTGMFDSLPFRNDAAGLFRRQIRSLPTCQGVIGVATCDKGLPAMMMALAATHNLPTVLVPGGVTLPAADADAEDTAKVQTIGARYAQGQITLEEAARAGCAACGSPGGGCQFLGTAATSQVIGEALGLTLPHAALAPSGQPIWTDMAVRSAHAMMAMIKAKQTTREILTDDSVHNAMVVHAACGGSTNLLLHLPAIAFSGACRRPTVEDWNAVNRQVPRFVDVLPNGPTNHPTIRVFMAGGVPEVMLHLREMGLLRLNAKNVAGLTIDATLAWWEKSERRRVLRQRLAEQDGVDPDEVILPPSVARQRGLTSTVCFPIGNLCPEGSVIKATAIDPSVVDPDGVYRKTGTARVFTTESDAIRAIKGQTDRPVRPGDVVVLIGRGPLGSGMEETYQITSALKYLPWGKDVAVLTDARFSGVSTGACIGHMGPEALAGGPLGKVHDGDQIRILVDRNQLTGSVDLIGDGQQTWTPDQAAVVLANRPANVNLMPDPLVPAETRLWAALQQVGGGTWGGCVFDVDAILERLKLGSNG